MAEGEEKKNEYHIRLLTFLIGPATETLHLFFEIKVLNSLDFFIFLEKHKHILFHEFHAAVPCCECDISYIEDSQKRACLNRSQFNLLFETDDKQECQCHTKKQGKHIKQLCLCGVTAKRTSTVDAMDITLLSAVIKACCPAGSISGNPKWIEEIRDARNFIVHCPSDKITKPEFDRRFAIVEQSVFNLASVVGPVFSKMMKGQISFFKNSDLSTIKEFIRSSNDSILQIVEGFVEEQTQTIQSLVDQTRSLAKDSKDMKTEVLSHLDKQKDDIVIEMRNIVFEVKTVIQSEKSTATYPVRKAMSQDHDVCYVEWRLATPGNWNVDEIKKTLTNISSLIGQWFHCFAIKIKSDMAEAEESKEEYYIRLLTFIIGPATEVLQLYFEIKVLNSLDFFIFLDNHKHVLFHELYPSIPCCECKTLPLAGPQKKCCLTGTQFDSLFETDKGQEVEDHKRKEGRQIKQICLCSISAKRTTSVVLMDITLLCSVNKVVLPTLVNFWKSKLDKGY